MKLNQSANIQSSIKQHKDLTTNYEDGIAFNLDNKTRLYSRVCSCLYGEPKFYKQINDDGSVDVNQDKLLLNDILLVSEDDPEFILQLAKYVRNELNLRTISIVLLVEASLIPKCKKYIRKYTPMIVKRADELAEAVAYLQRKIGNLGNKSTKGSIPCGLKKGLADTFNNFDAYALGKYNRKGMVKLKDVLKLVHPKPKNEEQSLLFKRLKEDTLESPETWEVILSNYKEKGFENKKQCWEYIINDIWCIKNEQL